MRTFLAGVSGLVMTVAGRYIAGRDGMANRERISQGVAGAGLVLLYFTFYAAVNMYGFISPAMGFAGMAAVTAAAVILSMRLGQPIAIFALAGGLLTPALMGSDAPSAVLLFGYLFAMSVGIFYMTIRNGWWILSAFVIAGFFGWVGVWDALHFSESDRAALVLFPMAIAGVVIFMTAKFLKEETRGPGGINPAFILNGIAVAGGFLSVCLIGMNVTLTIFDWSMLTLLSAACVALTYHRRDMYRRLLTAKLAADIILFTVWIGGAVSPGAIFAVAAEMTFVYVAATTLIAMRSGQAYFWSAVQAVFAVSFFLLCYAHFKTDADFPKDLWAFSALGIAGLCAFAAAGCHRRLPGDIDGREKTMSVYALTATAFLSFGLYILLPWSTFSLAVALEIFALACLHSRFGFRFLQTISVILTVLFIGLNLEMIASFAGLAVGSLFGSHHSIAGSFIRPAVYLDKLLLCFILFAAAFYLYEDKRQSLPQWLFAMAAGLLCASLYFTIKYLFHGAVDLSLKTGFIERGVITAMLAGTGLAIVRLGRIYDAAVVKNTAFILIHAALFRLAWFDLLIGNPYFSARQQVGDWPLINGVTMTYGGGLLLTVWAAFHYADKRRLYGAFALVLLFALTTLTVTQLFHGGVLSPHRTENRELYAYSIVWLLTSLGLLYLGMAKGSKGVRIAAMAFMTLTIAKVFLVDAGELEGLYRIFSFFGLGVCLIGLSYFYTRFVAKNASRGT